MRRLLPAILLVLLAGMTTGNAADAGRPVRFTTTDNVAIAGAFYEPSRGPAPVVILLHSLGRSRSQWSEFATALQRNGIAALAIDLRGHGESTRRLVAGGALDLAFAQFKPSDYEDMQFDVDAAVNWLSQHPGIDTSRIAIIGSSVGANVALRYATVNDDLAALMLFSPGITYKGLRADEAMKELRPMPVRIVTSIGDAFAYESGKRLDEIRKEAGHAHDVEELWVTGGNAHGADLLLSVKNLPQVTLDWLKHVLLGKPLPPRPPDAPPKPAAKNPKPAK